MESEEIHSGTNNSHRDKSILSLPEGQKEAQKGT